MSRSVADADAILRAAIVAADPTHAVRGALANAPELHDDAPVRLIAVGKAACRMRNTAAAALGSRVQSAITVVPNDTACDDVLFAAHPIPDHTSQLAGVAVRSAVVNAPRDTLLIVLLSGGASSLIALPAHGIDITAYADCISLLQRAGADIREVNTVRKHIDQLKGGRLAALAAPRPVLGLILSDVVGDPIDVIASGPLCADPTTFRNAIEILQRRSVWPRCSESVRTLLQRGADGLVPDTPKRGTDLGHIRTAIMGGNALGRAGAAQAARRRGYDVIALEQPLTGEARDAASAFVARARELQRSVTRDTAPICAIAGGEMTVTVTGSGRGGRNQEFVLAALIALGNAPGITIGSAGTDGIDGSSNAAGAIADTALLMHARQLNIDPHAHLHDNDSHGFFERAGGQIVTVPTGTNVMDVQIALIHAAA